MNFKKIITPIVILFLVGTNIVFANLSTKDPFSDSEEQKITDKLIKLKYANSEEILKEITNYKTRFISQFGIITADKRTNSLFISDYENNVQKFQDFITGIDTKVSQISVSAKIVNADESFSRELGTEFKERTNNNQSFSQTDNDANTFLFNILKFKDENLLNVKLTAMQNNGHGKIISSPKLLILDRHEAAIESGDEIPYQEKTGEGNTSISFKKAVLGLKVTPEIIDNQNMILHIEVSQDKPGQTFVNGEPSISTRRIKTDVEVKNDEMIVLGGVYEESDEKASLRIPILGNIPLVGSIFTKENTDHSKKELLVFIKPHIMK